jgi:hypothetical protein
MPRRPRKLRQLSLAARFASGLYRERARLAAAGYLRRDPMSLLKLRPGRENPYAVYDQLRAAGPLIWTRQGTWACTSYHGCDTVLRDRRFGKSPAEDRPGMSFLGITRRTTPGCDGSRCPRSPRRRWRVTPPGWSAPRPACWTRPPRGLPAPGHLRPRPHRRPPRTSPSPPASTTA